MVQAQDRLTAISLMNSIASVLNANTISTSSARRHGNLDDDETEALSFARPSRALFQISLEV